jgi:hypothetical protein
MGAMVVRANSPFPTDFLNLNRIHHLGCFGGRRPYLTKAVAFNYIMTAGRFFFRQIKVRPTSQFGALPFF